MAIYDQPSWNEIHEFMDIANVMTAQNGIGGRQTRPVQALYAAIAVL